MKRYILLALLVIPATALALTAGSLLAGAELPFKATLEGTRTGDEILKDMRVMSYEGTGTVPYAVCCTHVSQITSWWDKKAQVHRAVGIMSITGASGDQLLLEMVDNVWDPAAQQWNGTYNITGGTGRFEGASGTGLVVAVPAGDRVTVACNGTISY